MIIMEIPSELFEVQLAEQFVSFSLYAVKSLHFKLIFNIFNQSSFISITTDIRGNSTVILTTLTIKLQLVFKTLIFLRLRTLI